MPKWPIRVKLIAGLSLVLGMMLILLGGSVFGLHAFHTSNLKLVDQLRELGGSKDLLHAVLRLGVASETSSLPGGQATLETRVQNARSALRRYYGELERNSFRGNRVDDGRDAFSLAFLIDDDLTAILGLLHPETPVEHLLPRTQIFLERHPEARFQEAGPNSEHTILFDRMERLNRSAGTLPDTLHRDFLQVLEQSKLEYQSSRVIVWISAILVMAMLMGLTSLFHRWVHYPVRLLQRGVRRVARGQFDYHIALSSGDEMQALAEAFNDMTNRLSATYADLETQIQERSRQLVRSERLASVGFLAAGVAHEINNPLAAIAFSSEAMERRLQQLLDTQPDWPDARVILNYLRMIQEEAFRCKGITEKLLDFSRCNDIQRQRTNLVDLVRGVVEMICHIGKYRGKNIVFNPREAVFAQVDPQEIKQVVLNLVVNALDSMDTGGTLTIEVKGLEGTCLLLFRDNGCGMSPEVLDNIFEPFFTKRKIGKGTGLGLSITHRIVSQHHGEITASSPGEGQGAEFLVRLPTVPPAAAGEPSGNTESQIVPAIAQLPHDKQPQPSTGWSRAS